MVGENSTHSGWGIAWPAPGKLNLMLRIVGRRADGYHLLQTVFQFIDRCDQLSFFPRPDNQVRLRTLIPGVPEEQDLVYRAAQILKCDSGFSGGVEIQVEKRLPMGGGLGGGSSDAATTLHVLNQLWGLGYSLDRLVLLGLRLGADVPIFLTGFSAWAEGVGEDLTPIKLSESWYVIAVPDCHVSTAAVFGSEELTRNNIPITMEEFASGWRTNDCLSIVMALYPSVNAVFQRLSELVSARLTGTGACVFAECDNKLTAEQVAVAMSNYCEVFVVKGKNCSPLHKMSVRLFGSDSTV